MLILVLLNPYLNIKLKLSSQNKNPAQYIRPLQNCDWTHYNHTHTDVQAHTRTNLCQQGISKVTNNPINADAFNSVNKAFSFSSITEHWSVFSPSVQDSTLLTNIQLYYLPTIRSGSAIFSHTPLSGHNSWITGNKVPEDPQNWPDLLRRRGFWRFWSGLSGETGGG